MSAPRFLVDSDVISETARPAPDPRVLTWLREQGSVAIAAITVFELARGIEKLPAGKKRSFLEAWLGRLLASDVAVVALDGDAAVRAARLERAAQKRGRPIDAHDLFILATASAHGLSIATHNVAHFRGHGVSVYDPFADLHAV